MATPHSRNESSDGFNTAAILTLIGLVVTIFFNILNYFNTQADLKFKEQNAKDNSISIYEDKMANIQTIASEIARTNKIYNDSILIYNYTGHDLTVSYIYKTLNYHWLATGQVAMRHSTGGFFGFTEESGMFFYFNGASPRYLNNRPPSFSNTANIRSSRFVIDTEQQPPYDDLIERTFVGGYLTKTKRIYFSDTLINEGLLK